MKRKFKLLLILVLVLCAGCESNIGINKDAMEDIKIYTSLYPIQYVTENLYKGKADIENMYPAGINPYEYKFTKKQLDNYSMSDLVIYNGLTTEKDLIVEMINKNKELKIIDATAKITYTYDIDEIWINPSNVIMMAKNVKDGIGEYTNSEYLKKDIEHNFNDLNIELSKLDANIKEDIENAKYKTIITTTDNLKTLEKYGLTIYSLDEKSVTDKTYNDVVKLIKDKQIGYIYTTSHTKNNKFLNNLVNAFPSLEQVEINTLNNISDSDKKNNNDYITIMNENLDKLKKELYK